MINSLAAPLPTTSVASTTSYSHTQVISSTKDVNTADTVSLSVESQQALRQEQYAPKNAVDLFNDWLERGTSFVTITIPSGDESDEADLLPENRALLEHLKEKMRNTPDHEERIGVFNQLNLLRGAGKSEIFNSESDLDQRMHAINDSVFLQQKYLVEKYGDPMGVPTEEMQQRMEELKNDPRFNVHPRLGDLTGNKDMYSDAPDEVKALFEPKGYDLDQFTSDDFLLGLLAERDKVYDVVNKRIEAIMNDFNHPYWDESLKLFES